MCFTPHETFLQILTHKKEQNKKKSIFSCFVTSTLSSNYKLACKRASFTLQKGVFYTSKGHLLHCKRASFRRQKRLFWKSRVSLFYKISTYTLCNSMLHLWGHRLMWMRNPHVSDAIRTKQIFAIGILFWFIFFSYFCNIINVYTILCTGKRYISWACQLC